MIIAVDFDDTLQVNGQPNTQLIARLKREQKNGNTVILWTCRVGKSLQEAVSFLNVCGFRPNYINSNAAEAIRRYGSDPRKIYADLYIDDKAYKQR